MLAVKDISKSFGQKPALVGVSLDVQAGQVTALLGPSGCGKSTLLHIIAGLETPDSGSISWQGQSVDGLPTHRRGFGLMFQDYMLFPHLDVSKNVAFGLQNTAMERGAIPARVSELLELVGLDGFQHREVGTLSGGEQQRVALARALAPGPRLLMLDEPLGALDRALRESLLAELQHILARLNQTTIYVTHDQDEAFAIADRVAVMQAGKIEQISSPTALYQRPASPFVARFLGLDNLLPGRLEDGLFRTDVGAFQADSRPNSSRSTRGTLLLRPDQARLASQGAGQIPGRVLQKSFGTRLQQLLVESADTQLKFDFAASIKLPEVGDSIALDLVVETFQVFWEDAVSETL
jgi:ABC-type Fe3+/spermidine/putrescine transport system ATPase subunit